MSVWSPKNRARSIWRSSQAVPLHERAEFIAWLMASCHDQHVPVTVTDPAVIARIATLLGPAQPPRAAGHTRQTGRTRSMSKLRAPIMAFETFNEVANWLGAMGYSKEYPIEMGIRGVRSYSIGAEGGMNIMRMIIARELIGNEYTNPRN